MGRRARRAGPRRSFVAGRAERRGADAVATVDAFLDALPAVVEPASREIA
jgi:hypothetical protein